MNYRKDRIFTIFIVMVAFVVLWNYVVEIKDGMTAVSNVETTNVETTEVIIKSPKKEEEKTSEILQLAELIEVDSSDLPIILEGVKIEKAVVSKATDAVVEDLVQTGHDPYLYNNLKLYVKGDSEDLVIRYKEADVDLKKTANSAIFEDSILSWYSGDDAYRHLEVRNTEHEIVFKGFSEDLNEISNMANIQDEFISIDGVVIKIVRIVFQ